MNPIGLTEANKTLVTPVYVDKGQTIDQTLASVLRSIGLSFQVRDGFLMIDSRIGVVENRLDLLTAKSTGSSTPSKGEICRPEALAFTFVGFRRRTQENFQDQTVASDDGCVSNRPVSIFLFLRFDA